MNDRSKDLSPYIRPVPRFPTETIQLAQGGLADPVADTTRQGLEHLYRVCLKYRKLILSFAGAVVACAFLYVLLATRLYTAQATLRIGTYSPSLAGTQIEDLLRQQTREQDYLNTQVELLSGLSLADSVLSNPEVGPGLEQYFARDRGIFSIFTTISENLFSSGATSSPKNNEPVGYKHHLKQLRKYLKLLEIEPVRRTSLVHVLVTTADPNLSAAAANAHARQFIDLVRSEHQKTAIDNLLFLKTQATELSEKVAAQERALARYAEENQIILLNKDENVTVKKMAELNALLTEATAKRIRSEMLAKEAASGGETAAYDDKTILDLRVALKQAESEYAQLSEKFKPGYPQMLQLSARIETLKTKLKEQRDQVIRGLEATYNSDFNAEKELKEQLEQQQSKAFELSRREVQYNILKREYDSTKDLHQSVLRQLKEAQVSAESSGSNISIMDEAPVPPTPSSPKPLQTIPIAVLFGILGGLGLALVLDQLDNTYSTPEEVQRTLGLPVLGVVPLFEPDEHEGPSIQVSESSVPAIRPDNTNVVTIGSPLSVASESFRTIRTGILLSLAEHSPKSILFTSGKKSEGKTTLVTNIAASLSNLGRSVIVVDADLRRPAIHRYFTSEQPQPGLVSFLTGLAPLENVIIPTAVPGLSCIPAGLPPPNPAELIGSQIMTDLVMRLQESYDHVLIDAPPLLPVTDSILLSRIVDGVVLVVRGEHTPKRVAQEAREKLAKAGAKILGIVLNEVDFKRSDYYYYYRDSYSYYEPDEVRKTARRR